MFVVVVRCCLLFVVRIVVVCCSLFVVRCLLFVVGSSCHSSCVVVCSLMLFLVCWSHYDLFVVDIVWCVCLLLVYWRCWIAIGIVVGVVGVVVCCYGCSLLLVVCVVCRLSLFCVVSVSYVIVVVWCCLVFVVVCCCLCGCACCCCLLLIVVVLLSRVLPLCSLFVVVVRCLLWYPCSCLFVFSLFASVVAFDCYYWLMIDARGLFLFVVLCVCIWNALLHVVC